MGCNSSKKNKQERQQNGQEEQGTGNKKLDTKTKVKQSSYTGKIWEEVAPLEAPYPQGQTNLNDVINPEELRGTSMEKMPEQEMFPERQVGEWVEVPVK